MTLETQMTLALLQELLMALRANDSDSYKSWLALGIEELGLDVTAEFESEFQLLSKMAQSLKKLLALERA